MITQIKGRLVEKSPTELVIDCNGLGYLVNIKSTLRNIKILKSLNHQMEEKQFMKDLSVEIIQLKN